MTQHDDRELGEALSDAELRLVGAAAGNRVGKGKTLEKTATYIEAPPSRCQLDVAPDIYTS